MSFLCFQHFVLLNLWLSGDVRAVFVCPPQQKSDASCFKWKQADHLAGCCTFITCYMWCQQRFEASVSKWYLHQHLLGFFPRVRGAESGFLVWSFSVLQSVIYLHMKGASAVVKSVIADGNRTGRFFFFFFFRRKRVMEWKKRFASASAPRAAC